MYGEYSDTERSGNYVKDHWLGNLPLPLSYWINGSLISGAATILAIGLTQEIDGGDSSLQAWALWALALNLLVITVWIWGIVGIWRSASRHAHRGGSPAWATVAKFMVIIGSLNTAGQLSKSSLQLVEMSSLAIGSDPIGTPAKLTVRGSEAFLDGWITSGTADKFETLLQNNPQVERLNLASQGGRIREAAQIAAFVKARKLSTIANGQCASACTMIFLAAASRSFGANSALGFHSPGGVGVSDEEAREAAPALRVAYEEAGLPNDFIDKGLNTPSNSMWYPTESELIASGAINKFTVSRIEQNHASEIKNIRENGPLNLDKYTKAVSASANGKELIVDYRISFSKNEIDWNSAANFIEKNSEVKVCSDRYLQMLVDSGAMFTYRYFDRNGSNLGTLSVRQCP